MVALPASDCICQRCVRDIICAVVAPGCYEAHWSVVIDLVVDCRFTAFIWLDNEIKFQELKQFL